jgi:hypothetical protein
MPPSWLRLPTRIPPELESADWSCSLASSSSAASFSDAWLASLALPAAVSAFAYEPVLGYLALGTASGSLHLFGRTLSLEWALRPAAAIRHLAWRAGSGMLVVAGEPLAPTSLSHAGAQLIARGQTSRTTWPSSTSRAATPL